MIDPRPRDVQYGTTSQPTLPGDGFVLGADIGGTNLRVALADSSGRILACQRASIAGVRDPLQVVTRIRELASALLSELSVAPAALRAIGAGAPGVTDTEHGIVIATSYLLGWTDVPLRAHLEDAFGIPAAIDNDVNLAAFGESRAGLAQSTDDFVFLAIGTGIGAGIVLNRQIHRGNAWRAGEIGYMLVPGVSEEPVDHGDPGPFEAQVGGEGIRRQWLSRWSPARTSLVSDLTATEIFDHARAGDALASELLRDTARLLSYGIYNLALVLNCPMFVLGGSVGLHPVLGEEVRRLLRQRDDRALPLIVHSALGDQAQLTGAVHLAIDVAAAALG
ncbi:MAG: ROK family protein [Bryobacteraceae bacterium]|jgi:glucokinase